LSGGIGVEWIADEVIQRRRNTRKRTRNMKKNRKWKWKRKRKRKRKALDISSESLRECNRFWQKQEE
jgi:hypothetical protein